MKYILSRYNHDISWVKEYTDDVVIYDRSENPLPGSIVVANIGSDIYDKFTYIIDNYDNLPDVALYSKANLPKYISKGEFDKVKDNTTFTPLLTQGHPEILCDLNILKQQGWEPPKPFSFYKDGIYYELNYPAFLKHHPTKEPKWCYTDTFRGFPLLKLLGIDKMEYIPFAPGSNYILPKEKILKHPKSFYEELKSYLEWDRYPGEAMIIERGLYTIWK
jgi:hypothetical protein